MLDIRNREVFDEQISTAIASHSLWKKRLLNAIESGESEWTPGTVRPCNLCEFGKWLDDVPDKFRGDCYDEVVHLHAAFHREAARILEMALTKDQEAAHTLVRSGSVYARLTLTLVAALASWKAAVNAKLPTN